MKGAKKFRDFKTARQPSELGRLRVLGGPDSGAVYVLVSNTGTIGRSEDNDVILTDPKSSRHHAQFTFGLGHLNIKDLGSAHGTTVNGFHLKKNTAAENSIVKSGDKIGIGQTVFEFIDSRESGTVVLQRPFKNTAAVGEGQNSGLTQFIPRPSAQSTVKKLDSVADGFLQKNKTLILVLTVLLVGASVLPEVEKRKKQKDKYLDREDIENDRVISSFIKPQVDEGILKSAETFFKDGFREYRAKNYLRAQTAFETALQVYGDHSLARIYLENTKRMMKAEAESLLENGKKDEESNRLKSALQKYDAVKRLYAREQTHELYREAEVRMMDLKKKVAKAGNE